MRLALARGRAGARARRRAGRRGGRPPGRGRRRRAQRARAAPGPDRARRDARAAGGRAALGSWRLLDCDALRHARAVRDVRGRDRARARAARRLRHRRPEGGRRRQRARRARRAAPQPPPGWSRAACSRTSARRCCATFFAARAGLTPATLQTRSRRGARVVESGGLENRCAGNPGTEGSNPSPSAPRYSGVRRSAPPRANAGDGALVAAYDPALAEGGAGAAGSCWGSFLNV